MFLPEICHESKRFLSPFCNSGRFLAFGREKGVDTCHNFLPGCSPKFMKCFSDIFVMPVKLERRNVTFGLGLLCVGLSRQFVAS